MKYNFLDEINVRNVYVEKKHKFDHLSHVEDTSFKGCVRYIFTSFYYIFTSML